MLRFALSSALRVPGVPRGFARDQKGVTAIEFAIVAVPFFGLLLMILQVGLYHFSLQSLDFAVRQAGRTVMTGKVSPTAVSANTFKTTYICPKVFWGITCNNLVVNSYVIGKTSDAKAATGVYAYIDDKTRTISQAPTQSTFCLGAPGDYVYLDVGYPYPNFMKRLLSTEASDSWLMRSSTVVFNEPNAKNSGASC